MYPARTMQVFRELGLYDVMREESRKFYDEHTCIITVESLAGKVIHKWLDDVNEVNSQILAILVGLIRSTVGYRTNLGYATCLPNPTGSRANSEA